MYVRVEGIQENSAYYVLCMSDCKTVASELAIVCMWLCPYLLLM